MRAWKKILLLVATLVAAMATWHRYKPLPDDLDFHGKLQPATNLSLLVDDTWVDAHDQRHSRQQIFDEYFRLIRQAQRLVVVDMFLFNDFQGSPPETLRPLSGQLTNTLLAARHQHPAMPMVVITDPLNTLYGGLLDPQLERLRQAGITVVTTRLTALRDSNPGWSGLWRLCCQWLGNNASHGWLPNPLGPGQVTLRSYLALLNFKANHRKTLVVDEGNQWTAIVTSANAHDGSSAHSNIGLRFSGPAALDVLHSELAVARFSGADLPALPPRHDASPAPAPQQIQVLTEGAIRDALLQAINDAGPEEQLDVSVFYLSHRPLVEALLAAHRRGVRLRILLDPNKDAFGHQKNGIPNRQVAWELHRAGIPVRWCHTHGEQCHTKMLLRVSPSQAALILGSANYTRRNLDNLNLETSVRLLASPESPVIQQAGQAFERRWSNLHGEHHSVPYRRYADQSPFKYWLYRAMEFTGWSSF
ncbi:MAG: phospholipase D family protein [Alcanivorax sp.]|nr:phospholipase D family protein [Alcanivorax sp.]